MWITAVKDISSIMWNWNIISMYRSILKASISIRWTFQAGRSVQKKVIWRASGPGLNENFRSSSRRSPARADREFDAGIIWPKRRLPVHLRTTPCTFQTSGGDPHAFVAKRSHSGTTSDAHSIDPRPPRSQCRTAGGDRLVIAGWNVIHLIAYRQKSSA